MTALTAGQLADALGCFWNAALQAAHECQEGGAFASIMVEGIAAVQNRLTEIANANVGIEPTSGQIDLVLLGVDDVVSGRVTDGLDPVRALEAAKDHLKASLISTGFEATIPERGIDACMDAMETQMLKYGSEPTPWRTLSEKEELRDVIRSGLTAFLQSYTKGEP